VHIWDPAERENVTSDPEEEVIVIRAKHIVIPLDVPIKPLCLTWMSEERLAVGDRRGVSTWLLVDGVATKEENNAYLKGPSYGIALSQNGLFRGQLKENVADESMSQVQRKEHQQA